MGPRQHGKSWLTRPQSASNGGAEVQTLGGSFSVDAGFVFGGHVGISLLITKASPSEIGTVSAATMADAVRSDLRYGDTGT